jgi:hypothetical protein
MAVGAFIGIRASFADRAEADAFLEAIDRALRDARLPAYTEPVPLPDVYRRMRFGRSELDHHSADVLVALARRAEDIGNGEHLALIGRHPYRVALLPLDFAMPLETEYSERIVGNPTPIWVGSAYGLRRDVCALAPALGIPLLGDVLSDQVADLINEGESLDDDDFGQLWEDERTAWLLLYEGARLAIEHGIALSLAG